MRLAIHQPEYWPIPRLLAKWAQADLLVLLDHVPFNRASLQHRCRLAREGEDRWLTIPFRHIGQPQQIRVVEPADITWPGRHARQIKEWYPRADPARLQKVTDWYRMQTPPHEDATLSVALYAWYSMQALADLCDLTLPPTIPSSALRAPDAGGWGQKSDLVLNLCRATRASTYLAGVRGSQYLDYAAFERAGISIEVQAYAHPTLLPGRSQVEFSALHTYLSEGPEAVRVTMATRGVEVGR